MIKNIIKWIIATSFAFVALGSIADGMNASAVMWLFSAFVVSPLFTKFLDRLGVKLDLKTYTLSLVGVLLVTFITFSVQISNLPEETDSKTSTSETARAVSVEEKEELVVSSIEEKALISEEESSTEEESPELIVHFIDVGQGDCTLIESKGEYLLIDAGPDNMGTKIQKYLNDVGVSKIDYLILTHPDSDHIGSVDVIATKFDIGKIYMSSFIKDNKYYHDMLDAFANKNLKWGIPKEGDSFELGDAQVSIIHSKEYEDPNNSSLCIKVTCGETSFLFAGDAESTAEKDMLDQDVDLSATVYHVSHHGSYTSSSEEFLKRVNPEYAVVSCAKDNEYDHPHQETLDKLRGQNVALFRTDLQGGITAYSDGKEIEWSISPVKEYQGGDSSLEKKAKAEFYSLAQNESKDNSSEVTKSAPSDSTKSIISTPPAEKTTEESSSDSENKSSGGGGGSGSSLKDFTNDPVPSGVIYIGNKNNQKLHCSTCPGRLPKEENRVYFNSLEEAEAAGYTKEKQCHNCYPYGQ